MKLLFLRVLGARSSGGSILAIADDEYRVRWDSKKDWTCTCSEGDFPACPHIPAVEQLIDPKILRPEDQPEQTPNDPPTPLKTTEGTHR